MMSTVSEPDGLFPPGPAGFLGWFRPHSKAPWRAVVQAGTSTEAWDRLFDLKCGGDKVVTDGRHPDAGKRRQGA
jgi:hypothetical protein